MNDSVVPGATIVVAADGGVVTLSGRVRTAAERDRANTIARQTAGVVEVRADGLVVETP
jgi:osmotically-inducible protein OsmY